MLVGGYTWGALADQIGRRLSLFLSLLINGLFGCASAFSNHAYMFALFRFISGVGVGASLPVVFSYYAEFLTKKTRGRLISWLSVFWMFGQITTSLFALAIIPKTFEYQIGTIYFSSWRAFVLICALPSFTSMLIFLFMPNSPRYLLVKGKTDEAIKVLKLVQRINQIFKRNKSIYQVEQFKAILEGDIVSVRDCDSVDSSPPEKTARTVCSTLSLYCMSSLQIIVGIFKKTIKLFSKELIKVTSILTVILFSISFSSYGVTLWFPEYVKILLENTNYVCDQFVPDSSLNIYYNKSICNQDFNSSLIANRVQFENFNFHDVTFNNFNITSLSLVNSKITSVKFDNVTIDNFTINSSDVSSLSFTNSNLHWFIWNAVSARTLYLTDSNITTMTLMDSTINKLGLYSANVSHLVLNQSTVKLLPNSNSALNSISCNDCSIVYPTRTNCLIVFDEDYDHNKLYLQSLYFSLATLPGNLLTVTLIDFIPRKWLLSVAFIFSGVSVFALWRITIEWAALLLLCIFNGVSVMCWNIINVISAESFPTAVRSTGTGYLSAVNRMGAIISVNLFGVFIHLTPAIPILLVASFLCLGAFMSILLSKPEKNSLK